ncbi:ATP-dependent DNA helicase [Breznakia pachnodae]|uniref:Energy-coupling factor transporter ATP-binding protein EcfA2 n=1 Tax=Breznakia pachnodae TaxID=265178 RepID=A0ABU0E5K6_9FIRM|nr:AAA family ATPase [Breznakia pachnodae]MDQ0362176.1 energy-coupling factor transporter ATP-binding protein EcfA2 [Breznakia pachnodae]
MVNQDIENIEKHIKTHSESSDEDRSAVTYLQTVLRSGGKINAAFSHNDKWPNTDGVFEFVTNPKISRRPRQNFIVQIKGTHVYQENNGVVKYSLKSLAFPAYIYSNITLDPGILFLVLNPDKRGEERVFWKYMSVDFVNSINYENNSMTIDFSSNEEIINTNKGIEEFCCKIDKIINHHSFIKRLDDRKYSKPDIIKIIETCNEQITESIDRMTILNDTRDNVSKRILNRLYDLCLSTLVYDALIDGVDRVNIQLAWEQAILNIDTKNFTVFFKSLKYVGNRIPDDGQSERLMLKYYDFLWGIRKFLYEKYSISVLDNLEKFPLELDKIDQQYFETVAEAVNSVGIRTGPLCISRYYVQKKVPFFVGKERYFEVTLQLSDGYATKYNRITAYTKINIISDYSIKICYLNATINLWGVNSKIMVITDWIVSINPTSLNKLSKIVQTPIKLTSNHKEYSSLMIFLTKTGINLLELIDLQSTKFLSLIEKIYNDTNTSLFQEVLLTLEKNYSKTSKLLGHNIIRYLLLSLREDTLDDVMPNNFNPKHLHGQPYISTRCYPFERNPFLSNLAGRKSTESNILNQIISVSDNDIIETVNPYITLKNAIKETGEIYFEMNSIASEEKICKYNSSLDSWESRQGYQIIKEGGYVYIDSYEKTTINILDKLLDLSYKSNKGQRAFNKNYIEKSSISFTDNLKEQALRNVFVDSKVLLIYGAAGTGKTTLIDYISNLMSESRKLFLTKTHTALQNLKRRINNPGPLADFISLDSFTKKVSLPQYDIVFIDECSTIDNRTMLSFLEKLDPNTFLVLAGDIYQIEAIDFGNWFYYAKDIIKTKGSNVELLSTWRTKEEGLINLWNEVRNRDNLITEKLVIDGSFSEDIGKNIFKKFEDDEVVLCLNYDGKFGLNNINSYFQNANKENEVIWQEWSYKVGDPILFNGTKRFTLLYNNLKGRIIEIDKLEKSITFTIDIDRILTEVECKKEGIGFVDVIGDNSTRIRFTVYAYDSSDVEEDTQNSRIQSIIPFQLAYAVSIHKAQGLEYDSVKIIIPSSNSEKITHGIFYTAITRAKKNLKIYWSAETMKEIVESFALDESKHKSLEIVKSKLSF